MIAKAENEDSDSETSDVRVQRRHISNVPRVGDQRRTLILDSIEALLQETTVAELSMESIASAASLSRTSLYFYFASKAEAVDALITRATQEMLSKGYPRSSDEDRSHFVDRMVTAALEGWQQHRQIFVAAVELASHGKGATKWWNVMQDSVEIFASEMQNDRELPRHVARQRGQIICWMIERNFYFLFARQHTQVEEQDLATELKRAALAILNA
jgi:AcrR family transcriptional regulator